jgi:hypothetical protein
MHIGVTKERLIDLQRTVDTLHGRIQEMQCELRQATRHSAEVEKLVGDQARRGIYVGLL